MAVTPPCDLPVFSAQTRLLVVAPHPDDETIATGLLIQQVRAAGGEVRVLLLTAGDNNPWPQRWLERRLWIGAADRQRWGRRRHTEMLQALACLDVPAQSLLLLGWPDLGVTGMLLRSDSHAVATVAAAIDQFRPSLVAIPSLDDRHPDHGSAHVLVQLALVGRAVRPTVLAYLVHGHAADAGLLEIHGTDGQSANKRAALAAHQSQMALSGKRMHRLAARAERYVVVSEAAEGSAATLSWQPWACVRPWLRLSVVSPTGAESWRWRDAPLRRDRSGRFQLSSPVAAPACPGFARLAFTLPSLWIFDHWGWCALSGLPPP
jgi:N-acetyl-1-D-myo-inositol-2-amino-2-deoxy-alpha-D-glucopyranoside deacetylase